MTYSLLYSKKAEKQLLKMETIHRQRILSVLERIRIRPHSFVVKLSSTGLFRLRVGDYRIIMKIFDTEIIILVVDVGHRKNIYRKKG